MAKASSVEWTREHFLIALNLYRKLPFGKLHKGNRLIIEVAEKMGRTPSSLGMKLCNFAALDPVLQARGIRGLQGVTKLDRAMWAEFQAQLDALGPESEQILHDLFTNDDEREVDFLQRDKVRLEPSSISSLRPLVQRNPLRPSKYDAANNSFDNRSLTHMVSVAVSAASMFHACSWPVTSSHGAT